MGAFCFQSYEFNYKPATVFYYVFILLFKGIAQLSTYGLDIIYVIPKNTVSDGTSGNDLVMSDPV